MKSSSKPWRCRRRWSSRPYCRVGLSALRERLDLQRECREWCSEPGSASQGRGTAAPGELDAASRLAATGPVSGIGQGFGRQATAEVEQHAPNLWLLVWGDPDR